MVTEKNFLKFLTRVMNVKLTYQYASNYIGVSSQLFKSHFRKNLYQNIQGRHSSKETSRQSR